MYLFFFSLNSFIPIYLLYIYIFFSLSWFGGKMCICIHIFTSIWFLESLSKIFWACGCKLGWMISQAVRAEALAAQRTKRIFAPHGWADGDGVGQPGKAMAAGYVANGYPSPQPNPGLLTYVIQVNSRFYLKLSKNHRILSQNEVLALISCRCSKSRSFLGKMEEKAYPRIRFPEIMSQLMVKIGIIC